MGQGKDEIAESPAEIREAIARARDDLRAHLSALVNPQSPTGTEGDETMPTKAKPKPKSTGARGEKKAVAKATKTAVKTKSAAKSKSSSAKSEKSAPAKGTKVKKRTAAATRGKSATAKAGRVLDTMAAGAVVGAVKAAAQSIPENEMRTRQSTGKVLGEMAPDAAVGAVVGAAKAVMSEAGDTKKGKGKAKAPKGAGRGGSGKK